MKGPTGKDCRYCSKPIVDRRADSKYCSSRCRQTSEASRRKGSQHRGPNTGRSLTKEYKAEKNREWRQRRAREYRLKKVYNISLEQYEEMLEKQDYSCAVCGKHQDNEKMRLAVDHDHTTLEIRGLLCNFCNRQVIGRHRDPKIFEAAAEYLKEGTGLFLLQNPKRKRKKKK